MDASQRAFTEGNEGNKDRIFGSIEKFLRYLRFLLLIRDQGTSQKDFLQKTTKETKAAICFKNLRYLRFLLLNSSPLAQIGAKEIFFYRRQLRKQRFAVFVF
jgi:hypothetical protein